MALLLPDHIFFIFPKSELLLDGADTVHYDDPYSGNVESSVVPPPPLPNARYPRPSRRKSSRLADGMLFAGYRALPAALLCLLPVGTDVARFDFLNLNASPTILL